MSKPTNLRDKSADELQALHDHYAAAVRVANSALFREHAEADLAEVVAEMRRRSGVES